MTDNTNPNGDAPLAGEANRETKNNDPIIEGAQKRGNSKIFCKTFGELAPVLAKMGYEPLPIVPGTKRPQPKNWPDGGFAEKSTAFANHYTGILTKLCPSVDIDVSNEELVSQIIAIVYKVTICHNNHPPSRTGMAPRKLLMFRTDESFSKLTTASFSLPTDPIIDGKPKASKVEILGDGQQFVAFAIHPETGRPYTWDTTCDPTTVSRSILPKITFEMAAEIIRQCDVLLEKHGAKIGKAKITDAPRSAYASNAELKAKEPDICESAIAAIPNDAVDFDEWIGLLFASKAALDEAGLQPFLEWSRKCEFKHDEVNTISEWAKAKPKKKGAGSIYYLACEHGWQDPRRLPSLDDFDVIPPKPGARPALPAFRRDGRGEIKSTKENIDLALHRPDICGYELRYDVFKSEVMLALPGTEGWRGFKDTDYTEVCIRMEHGSTGFKDIAKERIRDGVAYAAEANEFDSAQHWLKSLVWDGKARVGTFLATYFGTKDTPYARAIGLYLWSALAGRVMHPGIKADMVPVAVGAQGKGKSSTIKAIAPAPEHFLELDLGGKEDDMARMMLGKLVVELGELKGLRTREVEHVKSFITRTHEEWVPKFKEMKTAYPRRCIFFGSTNKSEFLQDESGHRRWLPFDVGVCAPELLLAVRDQLWAEGLAIFKSGGIQWQDAEQLAGAVHKNFVVRDAWEEPVEDWLEEANLLTGVLNGDTIFSAVDVLTKSLKMDTRAINQGHKDRMARVLKELGYISDRATINGKRKRVYSKNAGWTAEDSNGTA